MRLSDKNLEESESSLTVGDLVLRVWRITVRQKTKCLLTFRIILHSCFRQTKALKLGMFSSLKAPVFELLLTFRNSDYGPTATHGPSTELWWTWWCSQTVSGKCVRTMKETDIVLIRVFIFYIYDCFESTKTCQTFVRLTPTICPPASSSWEEVFIIMSLYRKWISVFAVNFFTSVCISFQQAPSNKDSNKAAEHQGFQQILRPDGCSPPGKHRVYDEQDIKGIHCISKLESDSVKFWSFHQN